MQTSTPSARIVPVSLAAVPALAALAVFSACRTEWDPDAEAPVVDTLTEVTPQLPVATPHPPRNSPIDVLSYTIDLEVFPTTRSIEASCAIDFAAVQEDLLRVPFDLGGLEVLDVEGENGRSLPFLHEGERLAIDLDEVLSIGERTTVVVHYEGRPEKGLWFAGDKNGVPTHVFTQGECEDSRYWFPCWDSPSDFASTEISVTMPAEWISVAAGDKIDRRGEGATVTETWRMERPHAPYLTTLVAGDLVVREDDWDGVPLYYVGEPHMVKWFDASFAETKDILSFLSDYTGVRYPYSKYAQSCVENFPFGGMENISATTLTTLTLDDERGNLDSQSHGLVAHEAAHQWFGDLVTCRDWAEIWLNEGFATYFTLLYFEHSRGIDDFRIRMRDAQVAYMNEDDANSRPIISSVYKDPIDLFTSHVYPGGASRLHLLRSIVGDDAFKAAVNDYLRTNEGRPVTTAHLRHAMEIASGEELGWFFDQWLSSPGYPIVETNWDYSSSGRRLTVEVNQVQLPDGGVPSAFRMPMDIEVRDRAGVTKHRVWISQRRETFQFTADFEPVWVRFDKHGAIPMRHIATKDSEEWIAIAKEDDDVNGRRAAVTELGRLAEATNDLELKPVYRAEIVDRLKKEDIPAVRVAAAKAAGRAGGLEAREQLIEVATTDVEPDVRVAALQALRGWASDVDMAEFALEQYAAGYSWDTMGAAAGLFIAAAPAEAYAWLSERLIMDDSPHDQLRVHLINHLGSLENQAVLTQLMEWARDDSAHPTARAAAVRQLGDRARGRTAVSRFLVDMLDTEHYRLRSAVVEALGDFGDHESRRRLYDYYTGTVHPGERRTIEASLGTGL